MADAERVARWKAAHPERWKEFQRRYYYNHLQRCRAAARRYDTTHRRQRLEAQRRRRREHRERLLAQTRATMWTRKNLVLNHYGLKCACCGEATIALLTMDHVNGCTPAERKKTGSGWHLYAYLIRHHFPPGFQTLCFNCNWGRAHNGGICPHRTPHVSIAAEP